MNVCLCVQELRAGGVAAVIWWKVQKVTCHSHPVCVSVELCVWLVGPTVGVSAPSARPCAVLAVRGWEGMNAVYTPPNFFCSVLWYLKPQLTLCSRWLYPYFHGFLHCLTDDSLRDWMVLCFWDLLFHELLSAINFNILSLFLTVSEMQLTYNRVFSLWD